METDKVAVGFSNCLCNFILMTAALKILRKSYSNIDLITDDFCLEKNPAFKALAYELFDNVKTEYNKTEYLKIFTGAWSRPICLKDVQKCLWWSKRSAYNGIHEVQIYLDMIGCTKEDFNGFLMPIRQSLKLKSKKKKVVLANSSRNAGSRRGNLTAWHLFPEISKALILLGYDVILVGQGDELKNCVGTSFIDKLDIFETAGVIKQCNFMITVDCGLMHIADALAVPIILLAGPTPMTKSHPLVSKYEVVRKFISCAPCFQSIMKLCKENICMRLITVKDVLSRIHRLESAYIS